MSTESFDPLDQHDPGTLVGDSTAGTNSKDSNWQSSGTVEAKVSPAELLGGSDKLVEAASLNGMGAVYEKKREFADAQRFYEEALAIYEEVFGLEHFTTALVIRNLARVLKHQGKDAEACLLEDQATEILALRSASSSRQNPLGGSSGFFELMGNMYTRFEEPEEAADGEPGTTAPATEPTEE